MKRILVLLYGTVSYLFFLGVFLYAIGFVGGFWVPKSLNSPATGSLGEALLINSLLLGLFAVQHTIMARPAFKRWITKIIPKAAERSTYVLVTNLILVLMYWQWRPMDGMIWSVESALGSALLTGLFWLGWAVVLISTFLIDHFDLFGLKQVWCYFRQKEYHPPRFQEHSLYKMVRHPLMLGFVIAFWATPTMTLGHLFFAIMTTAYILVGMTFEERDLIAAHKERYIEYKRRVPMLIPGLKRRQSSGTPEPQVEEN